MTASQSTGTIALERVRGASLHVVVMSSQGHLLPGAAVEVAPLDPLANPEIRTTDLAGRVSFVHLPAQPVWLTAAAEGFLPSRRTRVIPAAEPADAVRMVLREDHPAATPSARK